MCRADVNEVAYKERYCICSGDRVWTSVLREFGVGCNDMEVGVPTLHLLPQVPPSLRVQNWHVRRRRIPESMTPTSDERHALPSWGSTVLRNTTVKTESMHYRLP